MLVQKEKNVVKIRFDDESYIISPSLKQWDKGQIIQFLDIDDGAIVQFGTHGNSYIQDGQVEIPDFLMEKEGQTIIYVRFIDENSETTVKKVIIPINPKDKPKDYIEPENEQSFIQQVTEIMNETKAEADEVYEAYQRGDLNGRDGQDGAQGPQGERGPKGDKGDTGEQGAQGIQGQQGEKGEKGEKGERGEQGQKGETGTQGPPGEDYILTQSDKEEIASIAADMVPQYDDSEIREDIEDLNDAIYPRITKHPNDIIGVVGTSRSLSITAVGEGLTYQWQYSSGSGTNWTNVSNATSDTLTFTIPDRSYHGRLYRCEVTDENDKVIYSNTCQVLFNDSQRISNLETSVEDLSQDKADKEQWEKLLEKTLSTANGTALDFSDVNFNGDYKAIKIKIMGGMASNNGDFLFYRMNSSTAYIIFANAGKSENTQYEFMVQNDPIFHSNGTLLGVSVEMKGTTVSTCIQSIAGKIPLNQQNVNEIYELKISSPINFNAGTKVVVYGLK